MNHGNNKEHVANNEKEGMMVSDEERSSRKPQQEYQHLTCQFSYTADNSSELSFHAGEKLTLLDDTNSVQAMSRLYFKREMGRVFTIKGHRNIVELVMKKFESLLSKGYCEPDKEWLLVRNDTNLVGKIPRHYVRFEEETDTLKYPWLLQNATRLEAERLLSARERGTFLLRASQHYPGNYTLSLKGNSVEHYLVKCVKGCYTIDEEIFFEDILQLIEHYQRHTDGLCEYLILPVGWRLPDKESHEDPNQTQSVIIDWRMFKDRNVLLNSSAIEVTKMIGEGEHGKVFVGEICQEDGQRRIVAVKNFMKTHAVDRFLQEARMMMCFDCPDIIEFIGVTSINNNPCIVTELMTAGNVHDYLISRGRNVIKTEQLLGFARDTCRALIYLQKWKIIHRDVAASNILLNSDYQAKLSDFGLSFSLNDKAVPIHGKIRIKWTSPEALENKVYTTMSDVWSFGVFLWELFSFGRQPYPRISNSHVLTWLKNGNRMDLPMDCPSQIGELMKRCWLTDPADRPLFDEIFTILQPPCCRDHIVRSEEL